MNSLIKTRLYEQTLNFNKYKPLKNFLKTYRTYSHFNLKQDYSYSSSPTTIHPVKNKLQSRTLLITTNLQVIYE